MPQRHPPFLLHHLDALLTLAASPQRAAGGAAADRRRRQRLALARRLIDPLPRALQREGRNAELFWQALRWGGAGMALALLLHR